MKKLGIPWWIFVGTRTTGASKGIYLFRMKTSEDPDIPEFVTMAPLGLVAETPNPTFLTVDAERRVLFCVNEVDTFQGKKSGAVSAFSIDPATGKLTLVAQRPSMGGHPCHLGLDRTGKHLLVANASGTVALFPVGPGGKLGTPTDLRTFTGKSVHPERQRGPHPYGVAFSPDNRFAFVCDLGVDKVFAYRFDAGGGKLAPAEPASTSVKPGSGPRHLVFRSDGKFAYVVGELDSTVTAFAVDARSGGLKALQTLKTVPEYHDGPNRAAELAVHPSGKHLFVSNCGHDSLVLFGIDAARGTLRYIEDQSTYGKAPIHFGLDTPGQHLAVANGDSGSILILRAPENARVKPGGDVVPIPGAACVAFMSPPEA